MDRFALEYPLDFFITPMFIPHSGLSHLISQLVLRKFFMFLTLGI